MNCLQVPDVPDGYKWMAFKLICSNSTTTKTFLEKCCSRNEEKRALVHSIKEDLLRSDVTTANPAQIRTGYQRGKRSKCSTHRESEPSGKEKQLDNSDSCGWSFAGTKSAAEKRMHRAVSTLLASSIVLRAGVSVSWVCVCQGRSVAAFYSCAHLADAPPPALRIPPLRDRPSSDGRPLPHRRSLTTPRRFTFIHNAHVHPAQSFHRNFILQNKRATFSLANISLVCRPISFKRTPFDSKWKVLSNLFWVQVEPTKRSSAIPERWR